MTTDSRTARERPAGPGAPAGVSFRHRERGTDMHAATAMNAMPPADRRRDLTAPAQARARAAAIRRRADQAALAAAIAELRSTPRGARRALRSTSV